MLKEIDLRILGKKEVLISLGLVGLVPILYLVIDMVLGYDVTMLFIDVILPIALAIPVFYIFYFHLTSEMSNILKVYGRKKHNKYILKLILNYMAVVSIIFLAVSLMIIILNINSNYTEAKFMSILGIIEVLVKGYITTVFLSVLSMFIIKVSKNNIFSIFSIGFYIFQEISGEGSYTKPMNLFLNYETRNIYELETILVNRGFFIILTVGMFYYLIRKNN